MDYKTLRLREMAEMWKGTILEQHTVKLLAMLYVEDGTLTAERRHDCHKGVCYAIGIQGHHICHRGTPIIYRDPVGFEHTPRTFCAWKDGKSPLEQFEELYPRFSKDWREQFREYTLRMTQCIEAGNTVNKCIQNWNSKEVGRIEKVDRHAWIVEKALSL